MAHINITYLTLGFLLKGSLRGRHIIRVKEHPFLARTLMVEFPGDPEDEDEPILLTDQVNRVLSISELVEAAKERW